MTKEEILTKEIDLIQGCINRMAQNSFMIKGWCITIVTALIAFLDKNINAFVLGFIFIIPILAFWYLDSFFLLTERLYRRKYNWIIQNRLESDDKIFDLNPNTFKDKKKDKEIKIMFSKTLRCFYLMLLGTVLLVTIIIGLSQNKKQITEKGITKAQIENMIDERVQKGVLDFLDKKNPFTIKPFTNTTESITPEFKQGTNSNTGKTNEKF